MLNPFCLPLSSSNNSMVIMNKLTLAAVTAVITTVIQHPPPARREVGGWAPSWSMEWRAASRLVALGVLDALIDCLLLYVLLAHSDDSTGSALMSLRKKLRALHRPQAMGTSGLGVDLDLGLRSIIEMKLGRTLQSVMEDFTKETEFAKWVPEDVMRVAFRRGLQLQAFPMYVVRWYAEAEARTLAHPHRLGQKCCSHRHTLLLEQGGLLLWHAHWRGPAHGAVPPLTAGASAPCRLA